MRGAWITVTALTVTVYVFGLHPPLWLAVCGVIALGFLSRSTGSVPPAERQPSETLPPLRRATPPRETRRAASRQASGVVGRVLGSIGTADSDAAASNSRPTPGNCPCGRPAGECEPHFCSPPPKVGPA